MSTKRQRRAYLILAICLLVGLQILWLARSRPHRLPPSPDSPVSSVVCGRDHTLAILENGTVWSWGVNDDGPLRGLLGNNKVKASSAIPVNVVGLHDINQVATGFCHCLALDQNGTVWGWGTEPGGQLGVNPMLFYLDPSKYGSHWPSSMDYTIRTPIQVRGLKKIVSVACFSSTSLALDQGGRLLSMGGYREVNGVSRAITSPEAVRGIDKVKEISGNSGLVLALRGDGRVWAWGANPYGELGNGNQQVSGTPVLVQGLDKIISVSAGWWHSMALKQDGTVWTWGCNVDGELGNGSTSSGSNPVPKQVAGLGNITAISAGGSHCLALARDGTVWAWGFNKYGQLGDGTTTNRTRPVRVAGLHDLAAVSAGGGHSAAIDSQGVLWTWGDNRGGQLGDGTYVTQLKPVKALIGAGSSSSGKAR